MQVLNKQYHDKNNALQQKYEDIITEMNVFKNSLCKKIQIFEECKEDLLREVNDLETQRKDKRSWVAEIELREK